MTQTERLRQWLLSSASIVSTKPLHPLAVQRILVQAALHLGITLQKQ